MRHTWAGRGLVVGSCLLALLGTACTPGNPPAAPPSTSAPSPTENAQEREQRLAYAAAESSYREFRTELRRVTGKGGAAEPTRLMQATASGPYLTDAKKVIRAYRDVGGYTTGATQVGYVRPAGYSETSLLLDVCEDERSVKTFDDHRKQVASNGILLLQLDVRKSDGRWKIWNFSGQAGKSCA